MLQGLFHKHLFHFQPTQTTYFKFQNANKKLEARQIKLQQGIQVKFFTIDQNVKKILKCISTKFELSATSCFQNIIVQN